MNQELDFREDRTQEGKYSTESELIELDGRLLSLQERYKQIQEGVIAAWLCREDLEVLSDYMNNGFMDDYDNYETEVLQPSEENKKEYPILKSGLLSQDTLYDVISEFHSLAEDMKNAADELLFAIENTEEEVDEDYEFKVEKIWDELSSLNGEDH